MDDEDKSRLDALDQKLKAIEAENKVRDSKVSNAAQKFDNMGLGYRMMIELLAGVLIGLFIGRGLDSFLGTSPWFLVVMVLLGLAAGVRVMMQTATRHQATLNAKTDEDKNGN